MSELISQHSRANGIRRKLLATVSLIVLCAQIASEESARAQDADRPTVWIELGGQLQHVDAGEEQYAPSFIVATPRPAPETVSPLKVLHPPRYSVAGDANISITPRNSEWEFSASVRYGRSSGSKHNHQQSYPSLFVGTTLAQPYAAQFVDAKSHYDRSYMILDFTVGKDVGLGSAGRRGSSILSAGVRVAQFSSRTNTSFNSDPDWHAAYAISSLVGRHVIFQAYHSNIARFSDWRSFHGVGPSVSWAASAQVGDGSEQDSAITLDWGVNAALLFGRQRATTYHQSSATYDRKLGALHPKYLTEQHVTYTHPAVNNSRQRSVIVPNVGGFGGLSVRYANAKVSLGYRADFFFGPMDGGIDTRKSYNQSFYGPYATISIGLGG